MPADAAPELIRPMTVNDIPAGMRLREQAGWNQTEQDWRRFLTLSPDGCFVASEGDRVLGTVTTLSYEKRLGWIGMLLVDPASRGRGIGTRLLRRAMDSLAEHRIETLKLDATPMGHPLYLQLGFRDEYRIERWEGAPVGGRGRKTFPVGDAELAEICQWDSEVFGVNRSGLLTSLWREGANYAALARSGSRMAGFIMGRAGSRAHYIGPWEAIPGSGAAEQLFTEVIGRLDRRPIFVDISAGNSEAAGIVQRAGYQFQRELTRMFHGPNRYPGKVPWICSIAGPELG